ncbi:MAG TPA: hypothetical protein VFL93_08165 [Longimicrobiaceae bacterium]|nr:hypothetical protein [Longimicrobiaceae bacterium]
MPTSSPQPDFVVCPHCWHINPASRYCAHCLADMTLRLQESGGKRWTAAAQSPMPVRVGGRLTPWQRRILLAVIILFGVGQLAVALAGGGIFAPQPQRSATTRS